MSSVPATAATAKLTPVPEDGNSVNCQVIRGPTIDDRRVSLAMITVLSETKPPTTTVFPPRYDMTGMNVLNILVDCQNVAKVRSVLTDPTTPTSQMEIKFHWNGDVYARSNPLLFSNEMGSSKPVQDVFQLASMIPPPHKDNEVTVAFINQYPSSYNELDRKEIRQNILSQEFEKLQSRHSTKHVYLYIHTPILAVYASLIDGFDTYWKEVIPMESFFYFTNDFLGKNVKGEIQPSKSTISVNTSFISKFIFTDSVNPFKSFDLIKPRASFTHIDFDTKSASAGNSIFVCVEDKVDNPFTTVTLNGVADHMRFTKEVVPTEIIMPHSDELILTILLCEELKLCNTHAERKKWASDRIAFKNAYELDCPLAVFYTMKHDSPFVSNMIRYACDVLDTLLVDFFKEIIYSEYTLRIDDRKKMTASATAPAPRSTFYPLMLDAPSMAPPPPKMLPNGSPLDMTPTMIYKGK